MRTLIINSDDFGFARDVNRGVIAGHQAGLVTATTLMANGQEFEHAVELAQANPGLDVGCHLVLVQGRSLSRPGQMLPETVKDLVVALALGRIEPDAEIEAQIRRIREAGIRPLHLDTHKHTHLHPKVLRAVARASERHAIRWVRRPFDFPLEGAPSEVPWTKRMLTRALRSVRGSMERVLTRHHCRTTDHFAGFAITGRFGSAELAHLIRHLPQGITELMCHVGYHTAELDGLKTRLKASREAELQALLDARTREAITQSGVRLARFRDLE